MVLLHALQKTRRAVWPEAADPVERRMVYKADLLILSYLCLQYCINFLNAYVSGMREALKMEGRQYNNVITCFTVGTAVGQIPQNLLLTVLPPRYLFPLNGVIWGILTGLTACATKASHLYVIKFFQGIAESSTFNGAHYILGAWYLPHEIGKRAAIFSMSAQVASLFSGSMMAEIYRSMKGMHGLDGWQWLFVICAIITIPTAILGLFVFPDTPTTTRSRLFTPEERAIAISRLPKKSNTKVDWTLFKRVFGRWHFWTLGVTWIAGGALESYGAWGLMGLWMKAQRVASPLDPTKLVPRFTVRQINYHPLGLMAVAIASLLVTAAVSDHFPHRRYFTNLLIAACAVVYGIIPLVGAKLGAGQATGVIKTPGWYFSFYLSGISYAGQMSNFTWANELAVHDDQERAVLIASINVIATAFAAWFQPLFFAASDAPHFTRGFSLVLAFAPIYVLSTLLTHYLQVRDQRRAKLAGEDDDVQGVPALARLPKDEGEGDEEYSGAESTVSKVTGAETPMGLSAGLLSLAGEGEKR
ncbi:hypothetical protein JCM10207_003987 [Rhodosporidiobolus poonsookiae]